MKKANSFGCVVVVSIFLLGGVTGVASAYVGTEEDLEYAEWALEVTDEMSLYINLKSSAIEDSNYDALELYSGLEYEFLTEALNEIDLYKVSPELQPAKQEFKLALQDYKSSAYYNERWAKYFDDDDFDKCISYAESGTLHLAKCALLTEAYSDGISSVDITPSPSPSPTPTPSPSPTPTPQIEKDSDGDGVPDEYDYAPNDADVQTKADVETPGFGVIFAVGSFLVVAFGLRRR